jgi:hypothetical protein
LRRFCACSRKRYLSLLFSCKLITKGKKKSRIKKP